MEKVFMVQTKGLQANAEEWLRVSALPEDELPVLSKQDTEISQLRHMTKLQYRRHLALRKLASHREEREGEVLGSQMEQFVRQYFGLGFRLVSLRKIGWQGRWLAEVADWSVATGPRKIEVPFTEALFSQPFSYLANYFSTALGVEQILERKAG